MHIGFRTSGGRGEYEVVGSHSGYTASSLEGWSFYLGWPDGIVRDTNLELEPATSGKPRLRAKSTPRFQIGRMVAAMLMLPDPSRDLSSITDDYPLVRAKQYLLSRIGFGPDTEFSGVSDLVTISPSFVDVRNHAESESIGIAYRWSRIGSIYAQSASLPPSVRAGVEQHRDYMKSQSTISSELVRIVRNLQIGVAQEDSTWNSIHDPLPKLEELCGTSPATEPSLPPPDELGEDEPIVSVRSAYQYRLAKMRGKSARAFARNVRSVYKNRCMICGAQFGGILDIRSGIDAAHILAWSKFDLDVVSNGLALCKLHHWAFDAALFMPVFENGQYKIRLTTLSESLDSASRDLIAKDGFVIPEDRLPQNTSQRPSAKYLQQLYADLAVEFIA